MPEIKLSEKAEDLIRGQDAFRKKVTVTMRGDAFVWLVRLAEWGLQARDAEMKADPSTRPSERAVSMASWIIDLENMLNTAHVEQPKKSK